MAVETYMCPSCGSEVAIGGICPGCKPPKPAGPKRRKKEAAKVRRKPWEQDRAHDGLDLPGEDFDYDEFVAREFGGKPHRGVGIKWYWWLTAAVLVGWLGVMALRGMF